MAIAPPRFCDRCGAANRSQALYCSLCGQALPAATLAGTVTGLLAQQHVLKQRYSILGQVGRGGFGAVYKAADTQFGNRLVAIKEMSQNGLSAQDLAEATASFKREALLLAQLTHPNLPRIYDQFTDGGRSYLVMDFIEGETLEAYLAGLGNKSLALDKALAIAVQLCEVLEYLHSRQPPIIFRDLKPANVMITSTEHVYLIDFGIARHFKPGQAKDTAALGSTGYAAPEQYGRAQTTARADIYALGATLHQILTGNDPADSPFQFAPLDSQGRPAFNALNALIVQMVSVDVSKRPASAAIVKQELQRIVSLHTTQASVASSTRPKAAKVSSTQAAKGSKRNLLPRVRPMTNTLFVYCEHTSRVTAAAWSPDGKRIASASYDKSARIWDASTGATLLVCKGHLARMNALAWSPNGALLATASDDGTVRIWEAATGQSKHSFAGHSGNVLTLSWSPDGRAVASAGDDKKVYLWDVMSGKMLSSYSEHSLPVHAVAWSPDGRRIASAGEDSTVHLWYPYKDQQKYAFLSSLLSSNRRQERLRGHIGRINALAWAPDGRRVAGASSHGQILVWDAFTHTVLYAPRSGSSGMKNAVAWSPNGKHLASAGNDKAIQIWNTFTRSTPYVYRGHLSYVLCVAWSPDGSRVASGGVDHTVQVWQVS